jgi:hypothetical protein
LLRHKRKAELACPTPVKVLWSGTAVIMRTVANDAAWVTKLQATTEWLNQREAVAQVGVGAQEVTGSDPAARGSGPTEAVVPSGARLDVPGIGRSEPGSTATAQATIEAAEAETSVHDAGQVDVEKGKEVVEAPPEAGRRRRSRRSRSRSRTGRRSQWSRWKGGR